jgi:crotonobetaine/carnitine-CoA ligase
VGRPLPGIEYRLVDDQDGEVGVDEPGQLLVRRAGPEPGLGLFSGYLDEPETTAEVWRGGWFHTGDVMRRDGDGLYYFVDRLKHMIRRSGQNIPAVEIEEVLRAHPAVEQVACVAAPDELRQEEVLACIIPASDSLADEAGANSIMDWALERLAYFKAPGWIIFVDSLPTTNTQKLQKNRIFEAYDNPLDRPGCIDLRGRKKRQRSGSS